MRGANYKILPPDPNALQPQQLFSTPAAEGLHTTWEFWT
jgi:hypothetical protein